MTDTVVFHGHLSTYDPEAVLDWLMCSLLAHPDVTDPDIHGSLASGEVEISFKLVLPTRPPTEEPQP